MAFINWNLVTTAVPTYYTYVIQPSIIAPVSLGVPNPQLPILQINNGVKVLPQYANPVPPELQPAQPKEIIITTTKTKPNLPKIAPKAIQKANTPAIEEPRTDVTNAPDNLHDHVKTEPPDEESEDSKSWSVAIKEEPRTDKEHDSSSEPPAPVQIKEEKVEPEPEPIRVKDEQCTPEVDQSEAGSTQKRSKRDRVHACTHCPYTTTWRGNLNKHVVSRHTSSEQIQWLQCAHCPYKGKTKDYLKCHLLHVHSSPVKWFECPHCPFKAKLKGHLDRHVVVKHTDPEKIHWLDCDHCEYKAKFKINLKQHVLSKHTASQDVQWHECDRCGFRAKRERNLRFHKLNRHTDSDKVQLFECEFCPYLSKRRQALTGHINAVHGGRNGRGRLKTKEIPVFIEERLCWKRVVVDDADEDCSFRCSQCPFSTTDKGAFRRHVLREHVVTELSEEDSGIVETKYRTRDVLVFVDNVPCVKKVIEEGL